MALCASGTMSLAGSTVGRSVACEIGRSGSASICMNESTVRTLAGVPSGQISMNCFYGKSNAPSVIGSYCNGGYYAGIVDGYYLLVSCVACNGSGAWKVCPRTATNASLSLSDGYNNTYGWLNNATHPAGCYTATRTIDGYSDYYLPAMNEADTWRLNCASMPTEGKPITGGTHWTSTEGTTCTQACFIQPAYGYKDRLSKNCNNWARPFRRQTF